MTQSAKLEILTHEAIPFRHGFFTRKGGASTGIYAGLNCGAGSADQPEAVALNRARVAAAMGADPADLVGVHQVHSPDVVTVTGPLPDPRPQADALVTATEGLVLTILTADCQPVLFADPGARVIGAAHAGWRGTRDGVLEATLDAMETLGAHRADVVAVIGPTISQAAYEVGQEFIEGFIDDDRETARFFSASANPGRAMFDLPGYALWRLRAAGVGHAEWTRHCTYRDEERFFSYRRTTHRGDADYGRLLSAIRL